MTYFTLPELLEFGTPQKRNRLQTLDTRAKIPVMTTKTPDFRAFRLVVEIDTDLLDALNAEAQRRAGGIRIASRAEVVRDILTDALMRSGKSGVVA